MRLVNSVEESFQSHTFPATTEELIDVYGEMTLELPNGTTTLDEVLGVFENETFDSAEDASVTAYSGLGEAAIGRKGYSDRDPACIGEEGYNQVSL